MDGIWEDSVISVEESDYNESENGRGSKLSGRSNLRAHGDSQ